MLLYCVGLRHYINEVSNVLFCGQMLVAPRTQVIIIALGQDYGKANAMIFSRMEMWIEEG